MQRFRPMGLGDIFDEAFDLYKRNFLFLLLVTAVAAVPVQALAPALALCFPHEPSLAVWIHDSLGDLVPIQTLTSFGPLFSGPVLFAPLYPLADAVQIVALAGACSACHLGEPRSLWAAYQAPLRRFLPLVFTAALFSVVTLISSLLGAFLWFLLFIPLILTMALWTRLSLTAHAFTLESRNYGKALGRSNQLVSGYGWRVFGCLVLLGLVTTIVGLGIQLPLVYAFDVMLNVAPGSDLLFGGGSAVTALSEQRRIIEQISQGLADLVLMPFVFTVLTVLYYDLRVRREAFDIELLARGLRYPPLSALGGYLPPAVPLPQPPALRPAGRQGAPR